METGKILLGILFLIFFNSMNAQNFGIRVGVLHNDISMEHPPTSLEIIQPKSKIGFFGGVSGKKSFNRFIGVGAELLYIRKGAKQWFGTDLRHKIHNYLALPILLKISPLKNISIDAGTELAYKIKSESDFYTSEKFDLSLIGGVSFYWMKRLNYR